MRLWHQDLIPYISNQRLLGQHRECCALRGNGWGRKQSTVDYVFKHSYYNLYLYHRIIMQEMIKRNMKPDKKWFDCAYRGQYCKPLNHNLLDAEIIYVLAQHDPYNNIIYKEHDNEYLKFCLNLLNDRNEKIDLRRI